MNNLKFLYFLLPFLKFDLLYLSQENEFTHYNIEDVIIKKTAQTSNFLYVGFFFGNREYSEEDIQHIEKYKEVIKKNGGFLKSYEIIIGFV